ncbi:MAG: EamA family transporter [Candidatus Omnitrophica bacterium]|nr:EamA family transporter [Candidatus Omnitrophota bacterium]
MKPFFLILISVILGVIGQVFLKKGMIGFKGEFSTLLIHIMQNPFIILGFFFYLLSSLIWLVILSRVDLSYAYPMLSLGYIVIVFLSWLIFKENITFWRWAGVVLISFGIGLLQK